MKSIASRLKSIVGDRTKVNLLSIILGGAGLLAAFTMYSVPELNMIFLGENPFAVKRDAISSVLAVPFATLAVIALFLQVVAEILGDKLPQRLHSIRHYIWFSVRAIIAVVLLVFILSSAGKRVARYYWLPAVVRGHTEMFKSAEFLIEHDGWRADQLNMKGKLPESSRTTNLEAVDQNISQIERLLELPPIRGDLRARVTRLKPYFEKPNG